MTFKRMMALGAMAAALAFTGCQDRSRSEQDLGTGGSGTNQQPDRSGAVDSAIPGSSNTIGGTPQDGTQPGTELGGTGATGGSGSVNDTGGTTNDDAVVPPANDLDHGGSGTIHPQGSGSSLDNNGTGGSGSSLDNNGTGGSGMDMDTNTLPQDSLDEKNRDPNSLDQRNQLDDQENIGDTNDQAR
jgi:hypothetical protein